MSSGQKLPFAPAPGCSPAQRSPSLSCRLPYPVISLPERREKEAYGAGGWPPAQGNGPGSTHRAPWDLCCPASLPWLSSQTSGKESACWGKDVSVSWSWLKLPEKHGGVCVFRTRCSAVDFSLGQNCAGFSTLLSKDDKLEQSPPGPGSSGHK